MIFEISINKKFSMSELMRVANKEQFLKAAQQNVETTLAAEIAKAIPVERNEHFNETELRAKAIVMDLETFTKVLGYIDPAHNEDMMKLVKGE